MSVSDSVSLALYGGRIQALFAGILKERRGTSTLPEAYGSIPLSSFTAYLRKHPLPPISLEDTEVMARANKIVDFINQNDDDILNLKRASVSYFVWVTTMGGKYFSRENSTTQIFSNLNRLRKSSRKNASLHTFQQPVASTTLATGFYILRFNM